MNTNNSLNILDLKNKFQAFPFHLVEPSPWPILTSFSLLIVTLSAVMYFQGFSNGGKLLALGLILTTFGMILWFRDVIIEGAFLGNHSLEVVRGITAGVALFIVSEIFAFLSVFWGFFHSSLAPAIEIGGQWPPFGIEAMDPFAIPLLNTIILLSSGAFITYSHHALIQGNRSAAINGSIYTIILAIIFTGLQAFEYSEAGFTIADSVYGSCFFAATGLHGLHVIVGTLFITVGAWRIINYQLTTNHHNGFEAAILYWHFVDVVWIFLFIAVYYWGGDSLTNNIDFQQSSILLILISKFLTSTQHKNKNIELQNNFINNFWNIISIIVIIMILGYFLINSNLFDFIIIMISFIISFLISEYMLNGFTYSQNLLKKKLQKLIYIMLIFIFIFSIISIIFYIVDLHYFNIIECSNNIDKAVINVSENNDNYNFSIKKDTVHKSLDVLKEAGKVALEKVVPSIGAGAAAGTAASAMIKATTALPPAQRIAIVGATAGITAMSTQAGLTIGSALTKQSKIIKNSQYSNPDITRVPSPDPDQFSANSPLESSPIEILLSSQFIINTIIIIIIIILLYIIISRFIIYNNVGNISNLIEKYMSTKIYNKYKNYISKSVIYNDRFLLILFIYNSILLIILLFINLYVTAELLVNLDEYIKVYNSLKGI